MNYKIGKLALVALCAVGIGACGSQKEPGSDLKSTTASSTGANGSGDSAATDGTAATRTGPASAGDSSGSASTATSSTGATTSASTASTTTTAADEPPADADSPIVRVYQVDGTDSIEVSVDARHMPSNIAFDDAHCKVTFTVGSDPGAQNQEKDFSLGNFLAKSTPTERIFRTLLGSNAVAVSYAFAATQSIIGSLHPVVMRKQSRVIYRRPVGFNIRTDLLKKPPLRIPAVVSTTTTTKAPTVSTSVTSITKVSSANVTVTRVPVVTDSAHRPLRTGTALAPRMVTPKLIKPRVR